MEDSGIDSDSKQELNPSASPHNVKICYSHSSRKSPENHDHYQDDSIDPGTISHGQSPNLPNDVPVIPVSEPFLENSNDDLSSKPHPGPRLMTTIQLQKRLERQIQEAKKIRQSVKNDSSEPQKFSLIPRNRLPVPNKASGFSVVTKADEQPLVSWESDSEEEFEFHPIGKSSEINAQLKKDGYNLDSTPDDEDLDLIPPTPLNKRCSCCFFTYSCTLM